MGVPQITAVYQCAREADKKGVPVIADGGVTSLARLRPGPPPSLKEVADCFVRHFAEVFDRSPVFPSDEKRRPPALRATQTVGKGGSP